MLPALPPLDLLPVFNTQPGATLLLSPEWVIVAASDDYLAATLTERDIIVGKFIFDAFPDNPQTPEANAVVNVRASLEQVLATKQPHEMAPQHYDVPDLARPGQFVERHWQPRHTPVLDAAGQVQFIIQSVQDITASRQAERQLRESQAAEQAARAEAEAQRQGLYEFMSAAPGVVLSLVGPQHVIEFANEGFRQQFGVSDPIGKTYLSALPGAADQYAPQYQTTDLYDHIYRTGEPYFAAEAPYYIDLPHAGQRALRYFTFSVQAARDGTRRITGVQVYAFDVTEQVLARQQVQRLNEELAAANDAMQAANDELLASNAALGQTQQQLQQLNQELEAHVQERTSQLAAAQAATERQRRQWYELFMRAPASICIFDGPEWVYEFVNPGYQAMFPGRALLGKRLVDALPEVADQPLMAILHHVYDTGEPFQESEVLVPLARTENGPIEDIYFDLTYLARYNDAGQIDGFVTYAYDVTEQVLARREREVQQNQLQRMFEQAPVAVFVLRGTEYIFEVVNPSMGEMLGMTPDQVLGKRYFDLLPGLDAQGYRHLLDHVWHSGQQYVAQEQATKLPHHGGGEMGYFNFAYVPLQDTGGDVTGIICMAVDVSPQVLARQQVQHLNDELHASNQQLIRTNVDLDNFIYTASHDLKAPISNIEGLLLALEQELPAAARVDDVPYMLHLMQEAIERFKRTIGHLTDVARLQQAHSQASEPVALAALVDSVRLDLLPLLAQIKAQLQVQVPADLTLTFSEKNLRSVLYNLLSNALKYHHPDRVPQIRIACRQQEDYTVLTVQDNGLGLDLSQDKNKLFALFERLHTHVEGTGIGLYMVRKMVENAGGRIEVESQLGQGTTFRVYFLR